MGVPGLRPLQSVPRDRKQAKEVQKCLPSMRGRGEGGVEGIELKRRTEGASDQLQPERQAYHNGWGVQRRCEWRPDVWWHRQQGPCK